MKKLTFLLAAVFAAILCANAQNIHLPGLYYDDNDTIRQIRLGCSASSFTLNPALNLPNVPFSTFRVEAIPFTPQSFTAGTGVGISQDDFFSPILNLPFNFTFYQNSYNKIVASPNGFISFNISNANNFSNWDMRGYSPLPNTSIGEHFKNAILGVMEDATWNYDGGYSIKWSIAGTAPNRKFVLSYYNISLFSCIDLLQTYQIILYESTNIIEVNVQQRNICSNWNGGRGVVGVTNSDGSKATVAPNRNLNNIWSTVNNGVNTPEAWRFTPDREITMQWYRGAGFSGEVLGTNGSYTINRGESPLDTITFACNTQTQELILPIRL